MKKSLLLITLLIATVMAVTAIAADLLIMPAPKTLPFKDVESSAWYYGDVKLAYESGLINGKGSTDTFVPNDNMTYAEAVKLAACMHQKYTTGSITLENGNPWYQSYVDYCKENGIITKDYDYTQNATRIGYMQIFANALPAEALKSINIVPDKYIPDVKMTEEGASSVYKLYKAGILAGVDAEHNCSPDSNIKRSEVATILARMMNEDRRVSVGLPKEKENEVTFAFFSDVHNSKNDFENTMDTIFKLTDDAEDLDGLVLVGDIVYLATNDSLPGASTYSMIKSNEKFVKIMNENKLVYAMGNHEFPLNATDDEKSTLSKDVFTREMGMEPERHTVLSGYHFITAGPKSYANDLTPEQEKYIIDNVTEALAADENKPVFLIIHQPIDGTLYGSRSQTKYSAQLEEFLKAQPRLVVFSAHMHYPSSNPQTIYQVPGGATFVYTSSIMGGNGTKGLYGNERHKNWPCQAILTRINTETNVVTLKRFYVSSGVPTYLEGGDWVLNIPEMMKDGADKKIDTENVYRYTDERKNLSKPSTFREGDVVTVSEITPNSATLSVPLPQLGSEDENSYIEYFKIEVFNKTKNEAMPLKKVVTDYFLKTKGTTFNYSLLDIAPETDYKVTLTPVTVWNVDGQPISVEFSTPAPKFRDVALNEDNSVSYNVYESRLMGTYTKYNEYIHIGAGSTASSRYIVEITKPGKYRIFVSASAGGTSSMALTVASCDVEYSEKSDGTEKVTVTNEVDILNDTVEVNTGNINTFKEIVCADVEFKEAGEYIVRFKKTKTPYTIGLKGIEVTEIK